MILIMLLNLMIHFLMKLKNEKKKFLEIIKLNEKKAIIISIKGLKLSKKEKN